MVEYKIYPICCGRMFLDHSLLCFLTNPGNKVLTPILVFLISDGTDHIIVDTGCCDSEFSEKYHYPIYKKTSDEIAVALKKFDLSYQDIKTVVLTHLHWDHCFHNDSFENAKFYVQKREVEFAKHPTPNQIMSYESSETGLTARWIKSEDRFIKIEGDYQLRDEIKLVYLPGHSPGSMGVLIKTNAGDYLVAGDTIQSNLVFDQLVCGLPKPSGVHVDLTEYYQSLKKVMDMNATILPSHEMAVLDYEFYPY